MLPQQEGLINKNRQGFLSVLLQLLPVCVSAGVHSHLINQPKLWEKKPKPNQKLYSRSLPLSSALSLCSYCTCVLSVCLLEMLVPQTNHLYYLLFTLSSHEEESRLGFSETSSHYTNQAHSWSFKQNSLFTSFFYLKQLLYFVSHSLCILLFKSHRNKKNWRTMQFIQSIILTILFLPQYFILIPLNFSKNVTELLAYKIINACSNCHAC